MNNKVFLSSLGCSKNLVDAEIMMGILKERGYEQTPNLEDASIAIVNTCGFIESAKEESINEILEIAQAKQEAQLKYLIVTGCLSQRYSADLKKEMPEVDAFLGTSTFESIFEIIGDVSEGKKMEYILDPNEKKYPENLPRLTSTPKYMAYLKIAEGCDNHCTYCIIPKLRGKYVSRDMEDIVKEAKELADAGVKELIVIAQDTTKYGIDLYGKKMLAKLLEELCKIENVSWVRFLYAYPEDVERELLEVVANNPKICPYFDIPIQHCNSRILKLMNRKVTKEELLEKINMIREVVPHAILRTSLITGFPTETDEEFEEMIEFVKEVKFDRLGVFTYSREEDTPAAKLEGQIEEEVKEDRKGRIMETQMQVSLNRNLSKVGTIVEVLVEEEEDEFYVGRTKEDVPEIDGVVFIKKDVSLTMGDIVKVEVTEALEYDLMGVVKDECCK